MFEVTKDSVVKTNDKKGALLLTYTVLTIISAAVILAVVGLLIFIKIPIHPDYIPLTLFKNIERWFAVVSLIFVLLWLIYEYLVYIFSETYNVIADRKGITVKYLFFKKQIMWKDMKEYGISYSGFRHRFFAPIRKGAFSYRSQQKRVYIVYFSTQKCDEASTKGKKRLRGVKVWWIYLAPVLTSAQNVSGKTVLGELFDFCRERTGKEPYIPTAVYQNIYLENNEVQQ